MGVGLLHAERAVISGNPFIGIYVRCTEKAAIVPVNAPEKLLLKCRSALKVDTVPMAIAGSDLAGLFSAANSNGIVLTGMAYREEANALKKALGINSAILRGKHTAAGNNILANDKAAIVNPEMPPADVKKIADTLGVEVLKQSIAGFQTVGSVAVVTNRGILLHNGAAEDELEELCDIFGVKGSIGTANMGVPFVGLCMCANSKGYVTGEATSGFELSRLDEAFGFVNAD